MKYIKLFWLILRGGIDVRGRRHDVTRERDALINLLVAFAVSILFAAIVFIAIQPD